MQKPEDYTGALAFNVPPGYLDVTSIEDGVAGIRRAVASLDHPYYQTRAKVAMAVMNCLTSLPLFPQSMFASKLAEAIMEAL